MTDTRPNHRSDILIFFAVAVLLYFAYVVREALLLVYVSALFAVVFSPIIDFIRRLRIGKWHPGKGIAILIFFVVVIGLVALFFTVALPPIARDLKQLGQEWPERVQSLTDRIHRLPYAQNLPLNAEAIRGYAGRIAGGLAGGLAGVAAVLISGVGFIASWIVLTAYFIIDGAAAFHWGISLFPTHHQQRLEATLERGRLRISRWLLGQFAMMMILGVGCAIVFGLMNLRYFYVLAVFAGLANFIPMVGPIVTVVLASAVAAIDSPYKVLGVIIFYVAYQQAESAFFTPRIMKSTVDLPGLAVIIALAIGASLAGILGALVAVPTAALASVLISEYLQHKPPSAN